MPSLSSCEELLAPERLELQAVHEAEIGMIGSPLAFLSAGIFDHGIRYVYLEQLLNNVGMLPLPHLRSFSCGQLRDFQACLKDIQLRSKPKAPIRKPCPHLKLHSQPRQRLFPSSFETAKEGSPLSPSSRPVPEQLLLRQSRCDRLEELWEAEEDWRAKVALAWGTGKYR